MKVKIHFYSKYYISSSTIYPTFDKKLEYEVKIDRKFHA